MASIINIIFLILNVDVEYVQASNPLEIPIVQDILYSESLISDLELFIYCSQKIEIESVRSILKPSVQVHMIRKKRVLSIWLIT